MAELLALLMRAIVSTHTRGFDLFAAAGVCVESPRAAQKLVSHSALVERGVEI